MDLVRNITTTHLSRSLLRSYALSFEDVLEGA